MNREDQAQSSTWPWDPCWGCRRLEECAPRHPQRTSVCFIVHCRTGMAVYQNLVPLVNIKIAGKWMFIPLKMVLIGIDPYPYRQIEDQGLCEVLPSLRGEASCKHKQGSSQRGSHCPPSMRKGRVQKIPASNDMTDIQKILAISSH